MQELVCTGLRNSEDDKLRDVFIRFKDADNAMDCIVEAFKDSDRNDKSVRLRMTKLGLLLPDESRWTLEVMHRIRIYFSTC